MKKRERNIKNLCPFKATKQLLNPRKDYVSSLEDVSSAQVGWPSYIHGNPTQNNKNANENGSVGGSSNSSSICQIQGVLEMEEGFDVIVQGRIGQGFYGEVFKGTLERYGQTIRQVAIKKLKPQMEANIRDFEREITIMKVSPQLMDCFQFNWTH